MRILGTWDARHHHQYQFLVTSHAGFLDKDSPRLTQTGLEPSQTGLGPSVRVFLIANKARAPPFPLSN